MYTYICKLVHFLESIVRQADTMLLTYPLNWNMSADIMKNDLLFYEQLTDTKTPGLTWSFFTVGFKWVGEEARMQNYFLKSYQDYLIQPFKVGTVVIIDCSQRFQERCRHRPNIHDPLHRTSVTGSC